MRRTLVVAIAAAGVGAFSAFAGCSLDLDESKIGATAEAGAPEDSGQPPQDGGGDVAADGASTGARCTKDDECRSANACLTGTCDLFRGVCVYDVCRKPAACTVSACDPQAKACNPATAVYGFHTAQFKVTTGGIGCGALSRCFAAAYPFVFVGTTNGVVAYPAADPTNPTPTSIPVSGLSFFPQFIVASGNRVYFVGAALGSGANAKLPLAWIDVPQDPQAKTLTATTVLETVGQPSMGFAFAAPSDALLLVVNDAQRAFPSALVAPPLQDLASVSFFPLAGIPDAGAAPTPVATSGARLLMNRYSPFLPNLSFEIGPGTATTQNAGEQGISALAPIANQYAFAPGADGSVLFSSLSLNATDAGPTTPRAVRLTWLVADANAGFDATANVDIETYPTPPVGLAVGPVAWVDAQNALVTAQLKTDPAQTVVRVASKGNPPTISTKQFLIAKTVDGVAAAASNGLGYVIVADSPTDATIHVFAPSCN